MGQTHKHIKIVQRHNISRRLRCQNNHIIMHNPKLLLYYNNDSINKEHTNSDVNQNIIKD